MQADIVSHDQDLIADQIEPNQASLDQGRSIAALCVEFLLYISIGCRVFASQIGILHLQGLSGGIIVLSGVVCVITMIIRREIFPFSFWFILVISVLALCSELYAMGDNFIMNAGPKNNLYVMSWTLMACYIVRNNRAYLRFTIFLSLCVFVAVDLGSKASDVGAQTGYSRLTLAGVATMFQNANELAVVSCVTAIALLFYSLRSKKIISFICITIALVVIIIDLKTVSRQGLIILTFGVMLYSLAVIVYRKGKTGFVILIFISLLTVVKFSLETSTIMGAYEYRLNKPSGRTYYFRTAMQDMGDTLILGKGSVKAVTVERIQTHNTFLWIHLAYGGLCAWTYILWLLQISWKSIRLLCEQQSKKRNGIEIITFLGMFLAPQLVAPFALDNFGVILALAILEKHFWASRLTDGKRVQPNFIVPACSTG
jgi:hypothetical protein